MSDAEQSLLGAALLLPASVAEASGFVTHKDFASEQHSVIWKAICELDISDSHVDVTTVSTKLRESKQLDRVGGASYLSELMNFGDPVGVSTYATQVRDAARLRRMHSAAQRILATSSLSNALDSAWSVLNADGDSGGTLVSAQDAAIVARQRVRNISEGLLEPGIKSGFAALDEATAGYQKQTLNILAARPSAGKTALALNIAKKAAANGKKVLFISLETPADKLVRRLIADLGGVNLLRLVHGRMDSESWGKFEEGEVAMRDLPIWFDDRSSATVQEIRSVCRKHHAVHGLDLVIIDYLQLITGPGYNDTSRVTGISKGLKALGRDLDCPLLVLSQLSRRVEQESRDRPKMSDLRESGQIEQDADTVAFLVRDRQSTPDLAKLHLEKNKEGPLADVPLRFTEEYCRFLQGSWEDWGDE